MRNTIIYNSNRYSVPLGTYTTQPEVRIETLDGILYIRTVSGEPICEHRISSGRGLLIQSTSYRRDRTTALDKLLEDLDAELGRRDTEFLTAIRVDKSRYARDQFRLIHSLLDQYEAEAALSRPLISASAAGSTEPTPCGTIWNTRPPSSVKRSPFRPSPPSRWMIPITMSQRRNGPWPTT